jgi:hypothetical protein
MTNYRDSGFASTTITRPSNVNIYVDNDVISTSSGSILTFSNITKIPGSNVIIINANIMINTNTVPSGMDGFRLHFYNASPTAIADNSPFNIPEADRSKYLGFATIDTPVDFGDTVYIQKVNINKMIKLVNCPDVYGILEAVNGFTPPSGSIFTISIGVLGAIGV